MSPPPAAEPNRQRVVVIAALAAVVVAWGLISGIVLPQWRRSNELARASEAASMKIERLRRLAGRKPAIERAYDAYAAFRSAAPDATIQRVFLEEIEQLAQSGSVQLNLKPRPVQREQGNTRVEVELDVDAAQDALLAFLDRLFSWPALISIDRLRISASPSKDYPLRASLLIHKLVIREARAPAEPAASKP